MPRAVAAAVAVVAGAGALLAGTVAFAVLVVLAAAVALMDLSLLLTRAGARPVLPVAAIPAVALPAVLAGAEPGGGWDLVPAYFAVAILLVFVLILAFGRRTRVAAGIGGTLTAGLIVGLGASSLVLLRDLPDGFRWVVTLGVLVLAAESARPLLDLVRARAPEPALAPAHVADTSPTAPLESVMPAVLAVVVAGAALAILLDPPIDPLTAAVLAATALVGALGGDYLLRAIALEAGVETLSIRPGGGALIGIVDAVLLGAPAAYILARAATL